MANNKMLIDASHPEETRVAVVRGNRVEEFDFESQAKKQLRGNIYLAKVTRVEPSLQAAFVDYGGNRHGFLAFSEIHPDYYQIPVADRQALLEEEARDAAEEREEEENEGKRRGRRRPRRGGRNQSQDESGLASDNDGEEADFRDSDEEANAENYDDTQDDNQLDAASQEEEADEQAEHVEDDEEQLVASADTDDEEDGKSGGSIAAAVETDSISEPAPEAEENSEGGEEDAESSDEPAEASEEAPKRKTRRAPARKPRRTKKQIAEEKAAAEAAAAEASESADADDGTEPEEEDADTQEPGAEAGQNGDDVQPAAPVAGGEEDESVESVGQEDALEEVPHRRKLRRQYKIQEVIKRRQIMLVQVVKEERGNKGAALTTYLSLAGRYSVLMPNTARGGGISRKITNSVDRKRLKEIAGELEVPQGMGVILRTAGASRTKAEVKRDFEYLMRLWENVRSLTLSSTAPCLVYEEGSLIKRSIRDLYDKDTGEVLVQGEEGYKEAKDFMRMLMPSHAKNVKQYSEAQAIFSRHGVEQQLDRLLLPQVTLRSGGYIVMNQTEALVSIDVNSGRSTREHSIEDTALQTNLEAADEVARQLRLRDLAGLIVIDFIDMEENRNNRAVEK
ncbi:MAG: Rne/Rng family ribonuclease, partial [Rhizobiaceae bacterium]